MRSLRVLTDRRVRSGSRCHLVVSPNRLWSEAMLLAIGGGRPEVPSCIMAPTELGRVHAANVARGSSGRPALLVLDGVHYPAHQLVPDLRERFRDARLIVIGPASQTGAAIVYQSLGADGYVTVDSSINDLAVLASDGEGHRFDEAAHSRRAPVRWDLTPREAEVLRLIERGRSDAQIGSHLGIAVSTTKVHVHHILDKLRVGSRGAAAAMVRRHDPGDPRAR